jgi:hypothetical protein
MGVYLMGLFKKSLLDHFWQEIGLQYHLARRSISK